MATNLWPNADLEANADDWNAKNSGTPSHSSTQAWQETYSVKCVPDADVWSGIRSDTVSIDESTQYTLSLYFYPTTDSVNYAFQIRDQGASQLALETFSSNADAWERRDLTFTTGAGDTALDIMFFKSNHADTGEFYLDGIMLETGASTSVWENYSAGAIDLVVADLDHAHTLAAPAVNKISNLVVANLDHKTTFPGGGSGLWDLGAYIYDSGIENPLVPQVIRQLVTADLDHALALSSPSVSVETPTQLVVADLDHVLSLGEPGVNVVGAGASTGGPGGMPLRRMMRGRGSRRRPK